MESDILSGVWPEWKIVKRIGRGSFGAVYEAVRSDYSVESHSAIKIISIPQNESEIDSLRAEGLSEEASRTYLEGVVNDFVSEIRLMESFKGIQNIVSVEDYKVIEKQDEIGWNIYIRMELLTPFNMYVSNKRLSENEVIKLGIDICKALELCAKRNVIHRDIKPENIFINEFGDFKLGDFGIARKLENLTGGLSQKGTYNYMAPEIERGNNYDATVDIYSLGLVLYRFTNNNRLPFIETESQLMNPNERMKAIQRRMDGEPLPYPCNASQILGKVILCACNPNPSERFLSATEMKEVLLKLANGEEFTSGVDLDETMSVRSAGEAQDYNETVSVRKAPKVDLQSQDYYHEQIDTFGEKINLMPLIAVLTAVLVLILAGGGIYFVPKIMDSEKSNNTASNDSNTEDASEEKVTSDSISDGNVTTDVVSESEKAVHSTYDDETDKAALLAEFSIDPNTVEDYSANLDPDKYIYYDTGLGQLWFSYPAYLFDDVVVDEEKELTEYGENDKTITFYGSEGSELTYARYKRRDSESIEALTSIINDTEKDKYFDASEILVKSDEDKGRIVLAGVADSTERYRLYDLITIDKNYVYRMVSLKPMYTDEVERKQYAYVTENEYRMCGFSGSTQPPRTYSEYLESEQ